MGRQMGVCGHKQTTIHEKLNEKTNFLTYIDVKIVQFDTINKTDVINCGKYDGHSTTETIYVLQGVAASRHFLCITTATGT